MLALVAGTSPLLWPLHHHTWETAAYAARAGITIGGEGTEATAYLLTGDGLKPL